LAIRFVDENDRKKSKNMQKNLDPKYEFYIIPSRMQLESVYAQCRGGKETYLLTEEKVHTDLFRTS